MRLCRLLPSVGAVLEREVINHHNLIQLGQTLWRFDNLDIAADELLIK